MQLSTFFYISPEQLILDFLVNHNYLFHQIISLFVKKRHGGFLLDLTKKFVPISEKYIHFRGSDLQLTFQSDLNILDLFVKVNACFLDYRP